MGFDSIQERTALRLKCLELAARSATQFSEVLGRAKMFEEWCLEPEVSLRTEAAARNPTASKRDGVKNKKAAKLSELID